MDTSNFFKENDVVNDSIDIYAKPKLSLKMLKPELETEFRIEIEGNNIDHSVINALRRSILLYVPIYGFNRSNVFIDHKNCKYMYNNDFIYTQLENLPIFDIFNEYDLEDPELYLPTSTLKQMFSKYVPKNTSGNENLSDDEKLHDIEISINYKNLTGNDEYITTHHLTMKINGEKVNNYLNHDPVSIIVLKPEEKVSFRAKANIGIALMHASYEATTTAVHKKISDTKYQLWYETLEQLDKNVIFIKACIILYKKLEYLKEYITETYTQEPENDKMINIELFGEEHTLGNLIATVLQKCEFVEKAGYAIPHPLITSVTISYKLMKKSKIGPIQVFVQCLDYLIKLFKHIKDLMLKMN